MKYCSDCGQTLEIQTPTGDTRERFVCQSCHKVHYQNPNVVAGVVAHSGEKVLLCRRGIEPQKGYWCLPAGFMENGESSDQAAAREAVEETYAKLEMQSLYAVFNLPHIDQVYMYYLAKLEDENIGAGRETIEAGLFAEDEIPWDQLAYPTIAAVLKQYFLDRKDNNFPLIHQLVDSAQALHDKAQAEKKPDTGFNSHLKIDPDALHNASGLENSNI